MNVAELAYDHSPAWFQGLMLNAYALRIQQHRFGRPYRRAVETLCALERAPVSEIVSYQLRHLRRILEYAYEHAPFYRRSMAAIGAVPGDIRTLSDLSRLPLLTKDDVRSSAAGLLTASRPQAGWLNGHTSGTTGSPLSLWYDRATCVFTNAADRQQKLWAGATGDDWIGLFLGRTIVPVVRRAPPFWQANHVQRQVWFSSFHMTEAALPTYVAEIEKRKLEFLEGYPSTMFILARHLLASGHRLPMRGVFTSSETLHSTQRAAIEAAFEAPLFDFYGMAERVVFASECERHGGKHLCEPYGITEIVDDAGRPVPDGEVGYVVATSLHNTAMPMIRYRTSDTSAIEPEACQCGRTFRRLKDVTTKAEDIIMLPGGRMISPSVLTHPFKPFDDIVKSQVIQETVAHIHVRVVARPGFTAEHEAQLLMSLGARLGPDVRLTLERVDDIPRDPSGKFRWVISRVPHSMKVSWDS